jgi:hypothetical protein
MNPSASGPLTSSASSRAHCCGLSRSCGTGPFDRSASVPPSRQALCHRRTDPQSADVTIYCKLYEFSLVSTQPQDS